MKYIAVDIETTGLDPEHDQVLEVGAVADDLDDQRPLSELATFHTYVRHDRIAGHPIALAMNAEIMRRISKQEPGWSYHHPDSVAGLLMDFGTKHYGDSRSIIAAGKNFGGFDLQFLMRLPRARGYLKFKHRSLDPATYFVQPKDAEPPSLETCCRRAVIELPEAGVPHTAREDAMLVVECLRAGYNRQLEVLKEFSIVLNRHQDICDELQEPTEKKLKIPNLDRVAAANAKIGEACSRILPK